LSHYLSDSIVAQKNYFFININTSLYTFVIIDDTPCPMKYLKYFFIYAVPILLLGGIVFAIFSFSLKTNLANPRQTEQFTIDPDAKDHHAVNVAANKLPTFAVDVTAEKFKNFVDASQQQIKTLVQATIVHETYASEKIETEVTLDQEKSKLIVHPKDVPNFKPGMYKLHLKLRTVEGYINIEQDFTWGVIAVNTNKSIYKPGDVATIGMGVLNDKGETHCMKGLNTADVWLTVTDPQGKVKEYSTTDGSIKDSGECSAISVTNMPDFAAIYLVGQPGIYKMKVRAQIKGESREIEDYFKVEEAPAFDVERSSFPTRIYPRGIYDVQFKITAKDNYSGTVEEIVPKNFKISKISKNGKEEIVDQFKKIIWNVQLQKGQTETFTYTINFPLISPEFYLLGPIKIGEFKEARQWQIASDAINSTSGVLTYEDNGTQNTWYRVWSGTTPWGSQISMSGGANTPTDSRWFREVSSPKTGEKIVLVEDNNTADANNEYLYVYRWDGAAWNQDMRFSIGITTADVTRVMDVAYEEESGDALFVYSDSTNQLKYFRRIAGAWDGAASNAGSGLDSRKKWVRAQAQFRSDNILVATLNDNERIGALIWDGSSFTEEFEDDDGPAQTEAVTSDEEAFDIAWETSSGTPMIFWGTAANTVLYREFTAGVWSGENTLYNTGFTGDVEWVTAAADPIPTSNNIALAFQESDSDAVEEVSACEFGMWNGSSAETRPAEVTCRSDFDGRINNVKFENNTGRAMWVYAPSESGVSGDSMAWRTWDATNGFSSSTLEADTLMGNIESIQLHSDLNTTSMIALFADSAGDLYDRLWDGSSWSTVTTALFNNIQNTGENAEAYGFGFDRNLETQVAYRWFANANTNDGGQTLSPLTTQDTSYTLTDANQQFRLRLLLYYPDSLDAGNRTYKLQYVDPGSGTCDAPSGGTPPNWTDVGDTSGTREISYANNTAIASASATVANSGGFDPTYNSLTKINQTYNEQNTFTTVNNVSNDQLGLFDFSLIDNTTFDRNAQSFCFRVARSNGLVLQIGLYPQIRTASVPDVLIRGGSLIQGGTLLQ
jgi:hypothetical protein